MVAMDETLIVKVSVLGMTTEGIGVRGISVPHNAVSRETSEQFFNALQEAFTEAVKDFYPHMAKFLETKYKIE